MNSHTYSLAPTFNYGGSVETHDIAMCPSLYSLESWRQRKELVAFQNRLSLQKANYDADTGGAERGLKG